MTWDVPAAGELSDNKGTVTLESLRSVRKAEILRLARQRGARNLRVFGSVARGEAREGSDLDLLVEWEPDRSLLDHAGLVKDLEALLGTKVHIGDREIPTLVCPRSDSEKSEALQDGVIRNIEVIGEAAKRVSAETRARLAQLEWRAICGMRTSSSTTTSASIWMKSGTWPRAGFPNSERR